MVHRLKEQDVLDAAAFTRFRIDRKYPHLAVAVAPDLSAMFVYSNDGPESKFRYPIDRTRYCADQWRRMKERGEVGETWV
jgi:hypothetical protein